MTKLKNKPLKVKPHEVMYQIKGPELRDAIARTNLTQKEFCDLLGFQSGSRMSHLCRKTHAVVHGETLEAIAFILKKHGVEVSGLLKI